MKLGWDVESYDDAGQLVRKIEAKGTSKYENEFICLTPNEKAALESDRERFWIYWIANLAPERTPHPIRIPGTAYGITFELVPLPSIGCARRGGVAGPTGPIR